MVITLSSKCSCGASIAVWGPLLDNGRIAGEPHYDDWINLHSRCIDNGDDDDDDTRRFEKGVSP